MYIQPVSYNSNYNKNFYTIKNKNVPSFGHSGRGIICPRGNEMFTCTCFFRKDMHWDEFIKFLEKKYDKVPHVNTIVHACSDGSEAYSLAVMLMEKFGKKAEKFFPIIAKDIDLEGIKTAKNGYYRVFPYEHNNINRYTKGRTNLYFKQWTDSSGTFYVEPKQILKDKIVFEYSDLFNDIEKMEEKNTVLFCRNFWPYMKMHEREMLAENLAKKFDSSSTIVIGDFDDAFHVDDLLLRKGFFNKSLYNVFEHDVMHIPDVERYIRYKHSSKC